MAVIERSDRSPAAAPAGDDVWPLTELVQRVCLGWDPDQLCR